MTTLVADSTIGISLDQLKSMLAESETFLLATGGTPKKARSRVYFGRQIGSPPRPFAQIELEDGQGNAISYGAGNVLIASGGLKVRFERNASLTSDEPYLEAVDWFSRIIDEVNALAGTEATQGTKFGLTHLALLTVSLRQVGENDRGTWHSLGRFYSAETIWTWGDA